MTESKADPTETQARLAAVQVRISRLNIVETKLRKLNIALANLAFGEKPHQLKLIRSARAYIDTIKAEPVQGVSASLRVMDNELISMKEGIVSNAVTMSDLVLTSGVQALNKVKELKLEAADRLNRLTAELTASGEYDPTEYEINVNQSELDQIPDFSGHEFILHRAPMVFTGQNSSDTKFSKVGYVDVGVLSRLGFSAAIIGGYTVVKKQMAIGINPKMLTTPVTNSDGDPVVDENGRVQMRPITVRDHKQISKAGKPMVVKTKRPKTALDEAKKVVALLERQQHVKYAFISQNPKGYKGGIWFWVMPEVDVKRFAKAFPGGHVDVRTWGFAGEKQ